LLRGIGQKANKDSKLTRVFTLYCLTMFYKVYKKLNCSVLGLTFTTSDNPRRLSVL